MREKVSDPTTQTVVHQRLLDNAGNFSNCMPEHFAAVHAQMTNGLGRRGAAIHIKRIPVAPVGVDMRRQHTPVFCRAMLGLRLHHHSSRTVAKQHTGSPVFPIENARKGLGSDHKRMAERAGPEHGIGYGHRIDKSRTHRLNIKCRGTALDAEFGLNCHRCCRKCLVGCRCCKNDEINIGGIDTGPDKRLPGCGNCQCRGKLVICRNMPLLDTGPLSNPLITGIDLFRKRLIGHYVFRQICPNTNYDRTNDRH